MNGFPSLGYANFIVRASSQGSNFLSKSVKEDAGCDKRRIRDWQREDGLSIQEEEHARKTHFVLFIYIESFSNKKVLIWSSKYLFSGADLMLSFRVGSQEDHILEDMSTGSFIANPFVQQRSHFCI